jgi:hypothetical protein
MNLPKDAAPAHAPPLHTRAELATLRGIRVASKAELKARIMRYLQDLNADPIVFWWRYKLEEESVS